MADLSAASDAPGFLTAKVESCPSAGLPYGTAAPDGGFMDFLVSITPPAAGTRPPTDVCCVVDVSGSMQLECSNGDAESQGLSVLDVVKHACKAVAHSLTAEDRLSVVAYNHSATLKLPLTKMTELGIETATLTIDQLQAGGQTNLWDGLHKGLTSFEADGRMKSVLLLTDGCPNISPPRGHVPMLKQLKEESGLVCTIHTFGFGYSMDSPLLRDLAAEGGGMYAFIPDGGLVGTVFVNAISNVLSTAARQTVVKVSGLPEAALAAATVPGLESMAASWGLQVPLGSVMYGQTRDLVVSVPASLVPAATRVRADVEYMEAGSVDIKGCWAEGPSLEGSPAAACAGLRTRVTAALPLLMASFERDAAAVPKTGPAAGNPEAAAQYPTAADLEALLAALRAQLASGPAAGDERLRDLIKDLEGQVTEALSRVDWFHKWGKHFIPSLVSAHTLQQCNNFKDPGVQHYGGPLFAAIRDTAEANFLKLPPPTPAVQSRSSYGGGGGGGYGGGYAAPASAPVARAAAPAVDMSQYYNQGGGCFAGSCPVALAGDAAGSQLSTGGKQSSNKSSKQISKPVEELRAGDEVVAVRRLPGGAVERGTAKVALVAETTLSAPALLVSLPGGLRVTPWHPLLLPAAGAAATEAALEGPRGAWSFPAELAAAAGAAVGAGPGAVGVTAAVHPLSEVPSVFNVVLAPDEATGEVWHGLEIGGVGTIALGHGIAGDPVASHPYYGTSAVLRDLEKVAPDALGRIVVTQADALAAVAAATENDYVPAKATTTAVAV